MFRRFALVAVAAVAVCAAVSACVPAPTYAPEPAGFSFEFVPDAPGSSAGKLTVSTPVSDVTVDDRTAELADDGSYVVPHGARTACAVSDGQQSCIRVDNPAGGPSPAGWPGYRFMYEADGFAGRFNPCHSIEYVINPAGGRPDAVADIHAAFGELSRRTGLRFRYAGVTSEAPAPGRAAFQPTRYPNQWAPVLVAFPTPQQVPQVGGAVVAVAGPAVVKNPGTAGRYVAVSGIVYFSAANLADFAPGFGSGYSFGKVALHELGHLVGLHHAEEPTSMMSNGPHDRVGKYGPTDLTALRLVGRDQGCLHAPPPVTPTAATAASAVAVATVADTAADIGVGHHHR